MLTLFCSTSFLALTAFPSFKKGMNMDTYEQGRFTPFLMFLRRRVPSARFLTQKSISQARRSLNGSSHSGMFPS